MNPLPNDPNGIPWELYGYTSYEAFIEAKAGANPPEYPGAGECVDGYGWPIGMEKPPPFAADDEDDEAPDE